MCSNDVCRNSHKAAILFGVALGGLLSAAAHVQAVQFGQLDDFQAGTTAGWSQGGASANPTQYIATGGPAGATDSYILNTSSGTFGGGSKQILFNTGQWAGNYVTAGVSRIDLSVNNLGATDLYLRLAVGGGAFGGSRYSSTNAIALPASSGWTRISFGLDSASMTSLGTSDSLATVLGGVVELRILSAQFGPAYNGDTVAAQLGLDNIRATARPGDANRDSSVNFDDLLSLAQNYGLETGAIWTNGDFNFDAKVDFDDLLILAQNYAAPAVTVDASFSDAFASDWARAQSLVPEPSAALALLLLGRRRR